MHEGTERHCQHNIPISTFDEIVRLKEKDYVYYSCAGDFAGSHVGKVQRTFTAAHVEAPRPEQNTSVKSIS